MTAVQLARRKVPSVLIDGSGRMNRGVAYSTTEPVHLLNVPSGRMSAWPDRPCDFAEWLGDEGGSFAERRAFGRYLGQIAEEYGGQVERRCQAAVAARRDEAGWQVTLESGESVAGSALVLANGNQAPGPLRLAEALDGELFVNNPWSEQAREVIARVSGEGGDVLILGTGLTMIDTVLSLDAVGHRGRIVALSRRGLAPRAHAPHEPVNVRRDELPGLRLLPLWRWLRQRSDEVGFRAAVDSLRPHSRTIWQALPDGDRRRFLRHARPWWDVHRHRIAPEIGRQLAELAADGRLEIVAGRVRRLHRHHQQLLASIVMRHSGRTGERAFAAAFNCTGPLGDMERTRDPLLRQLMTGGKVQVDKLGMGLQVDDRSRAGEKVWAVGPLTKGCYWEIVAVPDIRGQAEAVAADIAEELGW